MASESTVDITRVAQDSYPVASVIKVNGNPVDLTDWNVYLYYTEIQPDLSAIEVRITGVVTNAKRGVVKFYPRDTYCYNVTLGTPYTGFSVLGDHTYSIVRDAIRYEQDALGIYVLIDGVYILFSELEPTHEGLRLYSRYTEIMTHTVGAVTITARAGL